MIYINSVLAGAIPAQEKDRSVREVN